MFRLEMAQEYIYSILLLRICVSIIVLTLKGSKELLGLGCCLPLPSLLTEDLCKLLKKGSSFLLHSYAGLKHIPVRPKPPLD